jgi:hypothetical protein
MIRRSCVYAIIVGFELKQQMRPEERFVNVVSRSVCQPVFFDFVKKFVGREQGKNVVNVQNVTTLRKAMTTIANAIFDRVVSCGRFLFEYAKN